MVENQEVTHLTFFILRIRECEKRSNTHNIKSPICNKCAKGGKLSRHSARLTSVTVTHARVTPRMLVGDVTGPLRHDSYLLVLRFEDCLTRVVFRAVHQAALADADISNFNSYSSLKGSTGRVQLVCNVVRFKEALKNRI